MMLKIRVDLYKNSEIGSLGTLDARCVFDNAPIEFYNRKGFDVNRSIGKPVWSSSGIIGNDYVVFSNPQGLAPTFRLAFLATVFAFAMTFFPSITAGCRFARPILSMGKDT